MKKMLAKVIGAMLVFCIFATTFIGCAPKGPNLKVELKFSTTYGNVTVDKEAYNAGEEVSVKISPKLTSEVSKVVVNGTDVTSEVPASGGTYKFTIEDNSTVEVEFKQTKWSLSVKSNDESMGTVEVEDNLKAVKKGDFVTIFVTPNDGYQINQVTVNSTDVTSEVKLNYGEYRFKVTQNTVVDVKFGVKNKLLLKVNKVPAYKGTVAITPNRVDFDVNQEVTLTVTEAEGWVLDSIVIEGEDVTEDLTESEGTYTYTFNIEDDYDVQIEFTPTVTFTFELNGIADGTEVFAEVEITEEKDEYGLNEHVVLNVVTDDAYDIKSFKVNGVVVEDAFGKSGGEYTVIITQNTVVEFEFEVAARLVQTTVDTFEADLARAGTGRVLLDFWADNCSPCTNILAPQLEQLVQDFYNGDAALVALNIRVIKVRISRDYANLAGTKYPEYSIYTRYQSYHNGGVPFVVMVQNGQVIGTLHGAYNEYSQFLDWVKSPSFI